MVELYFERMIEDEKKFVGDLIRASTFYIVKTEEVDIFKEDSVFNSEHDIHTVYQSSMSFNLSLQRILSRKYS